MYLFLNAIFCVSQTKHKINFHSFVQYKQNIFIIPHYVFQQFISNMTVCLRENQSYCVYKNTKHFSVGLKKYPGALLYALV